MGIKKILAVGALTASLLVPLSASALTPMGGLVTAVIPCNTGQLLQVVNPGGIGSGYFMWTPGLSVSFSYGPPLLNSWVVGLSDAPMACFIGKVFVGFGLHITFHGTSLPVGMAATAPIKFDLSSFITGRGLY